MPPTAGWTGCRWSRCGRSRTRWPGSTRRPAWTWCANRWRRCCRRAAWFTFDDRGLVVETGRHFEQGAVYDLSGDGLLAPKPLYGAAPALSRTLAADRLIFRRTPIRWEDWAETWERDLAGKGHKPPLVRGVQLLPLGTAKGRWAARRK